MAYDFSSQQSGSGFPGGFPPMGDGGLGPEFGMPSRFGLKEEPEIKPTDEAAVIALIKEDLKPWEESNRINPELLKGIKDQLIEFFNSEKQELDVENVKAMIRQIESTDRALANEIETIARPLNFQSKPELKVL
jgi:hypothetical protein